MSYVWIWLGISLVTVGLVILRGIRKTQYEDRKALEQSNTTHEGE